MCTGRGWTKRRSTKINRLLQSISRNGALGGEGKPERLRHKDDEHSRRIDETNRLVYECADGRIIVKSCLGHYEE